MYSHDVLLARHLDSDEDEICACRVSFGSFNDVMASYYIRGEADTDNSDYAKYVAANTLDAIFRPYSTNYENYNSEKMPCFETPVVEESSTIINNLVLNPFKMAGSGEVPDVSYITAGTNPSALSPDHQDFSYDEKNVRSVGLRGPLVMISWGYDLRGFPVPNAEPEDPTDEFMEDYMARYNWWPAAPIEIRYDHIRKVWSTCAIVVATATERIAATTSGSVRIENDNADCQATNLYSSAVEAGTLCFCVTIGKRLLILTADCS